MSYDRIIRTKAEIDGRKVVCVRRYAWAVLRMFMHDMLIIMNLTSGLEIQEPPMASREFIK